MNKLISKIIYGVTHAAYNLVLHAYSIYVRCRVAKIRKKKKIRFLFVLQDLSQWKSENLYLFMLQHERFDPVLGITNNLEILRLCKKHDVPLILGSDAHISFQIADYSRIMPLGEEVGFPDELIMNYWPEQFFKYFQRPF